MKNKLKIKNKRQNENKKFSNRKSKLKIIDIFYEKKIKKNKL